MTPWTVACQASLSLGFLRQKYWTGSRGSSWPRDWTHISCIGRCHVYHWATWESQSQWRWQMAWPVKVFASIASFYLSFNLYIFLPKCTTSNFQELIWGSGCIDTNQYFSSFFFFPRISHNILLKINFNRLGKGIKEWGKGSPVSPVLGESSALTCWRQRWWTRAMQGIIKAPCPPFLVVLKVMLLRVVCFI